MAWGKQGDNRTIEEVFGMSEADVKAALAKAKEVDNITAKNNNLEAAIAGQATVLDELKTKLAGLETQNRPNPNPNPNPNPTGEEEPDWMLDPANAFKKGMAPVVGLTLETRAETIFDRVYNRLRSEPLFSKLEKEWRELVKAQPVQARANEETVENCYNIVYARHRHEIERDRSAGKGEFFVESGRNQINGGSTIEKTPVEKLSPEELAMAQRLGLSPEKYAQQKASTKIVGVL